MLPAVCIQLSPLRPRYKMYIATISMSPLILIFFNFMFGFALDCVDGWTFDYCTFLFEQDILILEVAQ